MAYLGDPRFLFLDNGHAFHATYTQKLAIYTEIVKVKEEAVVSHAPPAKEPSGGLSVVATEAAEDEERLKNERRKKAALFLNKLRQIKTLSKDNVVILSQATQFRPIFLSFVVVFRSFSFCLLFLNYSSVIVAFSLIAVSLLLV